MEETKNNPADVCEEQASETVEEKVDVEETINEETAEPETEEKISGKEKKKLKKAEAEIEKLTAALSEEQEKYMSQDKFTDFYPKTNNTVTEI